MSRLPGHRPETPDPTDDRWLTARPAVLAKRSEPGRHTSRPTVDGPGRTPSESPPHDSVDSTSLRLAGLCLENVQAIPAWARAFRRLELVVSTRFRPLALAR